MGAIVAFNPDAFKLDYPEFASATNAQLNALFKRATLYLANDGTGPINDDATQSILLNLIVAHLAQMNIGANGGGAQQMVGRISNATEGSVSVQTDSIDLKGVPAWWAQTRYGYDYYVAMTPYRCGRYIPSKSRNSYPLGLAWRR